MPKRIYIPVVESVEIERVGLFSPDRLLVGDKLAEGVIISRDKHSIETNLGVYPISDLVNDDGKVDVLGTVCSTRVRLKRDKSWFKKGRKKKYTAKQSSKFQDIKHSIVR